MALPTLVQLQTCFPLAQDLILEVTRTQFSKHGIKLNSREETSEPYLILGTRNKNLM